MAQRPRAEVGAGGEEPRFEREEQKHGEHTRRVQRTRNAKDAEESGAHGSARLRAPRPRALTWHAPQFHAACIDRWLESSDSCPVCKTRVLPPTP